ncbi:MAG: aldehyde dehydrogenase (NAD(P)(+)) ald5 [Watsoniomyces obsoletus]|nr:MAG: aldehyde dehydrogenase (NAD(P)(+)) ald5 [Watsoniomyces obsoletus]
MAVKLLLSVSALLASFFIVTSAARINNGMTLVRRQATITSEGSFGYNDDRGPVNWANLNPEQNRQCSHGRNQSPINVVPGSGSVTAVPPRDRPTFDYQPMDSAVFSNVGDTIKAFVKGSIEFDGAKWNLDQFHVHVPSEHRLSEEHYPMEVHFVHTRAEQTSGGPNVLVLGMFFQMAQDADLFPMFRRTLGRAEEIASAGQSIRTERLNFEPFTERFRNNAVYRYGGSFTTPPCTEGVLWLVSGATIQLDVRTYNAVKRVVKFNSRHTQNQPRQENQIDLAANLFCPA